MGLDATQIIPGLWQGGRPRMGGTVRAAGFSMLILCAVEYQPPMTVMEWQEADLAMVIARYGAPFPGVRVYHCPLWDIFDSPPTRETLRMAIDASIAAADAIRMGGRVLVTCQQGKNRSGLVSALTVHRLQGLSGEACVAVVKRARRIALTNPQFVEALARIPIRRTVASSPIDF